MTVTVWIGVAAGVAFAVYRNPKAAREFAAAVVAVGAALALPIAAGVALLVGHAPPRRGHGAHVPPPTAPPRRTVSLTLGQHLRRLYVDEDAITAAQFDTLLGAAGAAHVTERLLPGGAGLVEVLEALTAAQAAKAFDERPYDSFTTHEAAAVAVAGGDWREPLERPRIKPGDVMQLLDGETVQQAEQRVGHAITETNAVRVGLAGGYVLARLGEPLFPAPRVGDVCDCRGVAGDCGPCDNACRAPGGPRDPTNRERS